ncbi:MAG: hypothetical protein J1F42_12970 [Lachnospiraceae bacterium]|nr:hypothetical protein [Lachnospiraceae bacterium]
MKRMRGKGFGILTVILILIIVFCVKATVMSRENTAGSKNNKYYAALEEEYLNRTRQLLEEEGLRNCGVDLRWVADVDGTREYTMILHHRKLDRMSAQEMAELTDRLTAAEFQDDVCSFIYVIG